MTDRDKAVEDYKAGLSYKEIAEKHNISESAVKSWASRFWNKDNKIKAARKKAKNRNKTKKKVATKNNAKRSQKVADKPQRKRGGQPGNINALGCGAPKGNHNHYIHGGYSAVYWDTLTEDEKQLLQDGELDEETHLKEQLNLYSIREHRILKAIKQIREGSVDDNIEVSQSKGVDKKTNSSGALLNKNTSVNKHLENVNLALMRMERELTSVQRNKTTVITALAELHRQNGAGSDDWLEDFFAAAEEVEDEEN